MNNVLTTASEICKEMVYIELIGVVNIPPKFSFVLLRFIVFGDFIQVINQHVIG